MARLTFLRTRGDTARLLGAEGRTAQTSCPRATASWAAGVWEHSLSSQNDVVVWGLLLMEPLFFFLSKLGVSWPDQRHPFTDSLLCLLFQLFPRPPPPNLASSCLVYFSSSLRPRGWHPARPPLLTSPVPAHGLCREEAEGRSQGTQMDGLHLGQHRK